MTLDQQLLATFESFEIRVIAAGITSTFTPANPPPRVLRCTAPGCTGTGIHLHTHVLAALALAAKSPYRLISHDAADECQGTLLHNNVALRPCARPFAIHITGTRRTGAHGGPGTPTPQVT